MGDWLSVDFPSVADAQNQAVIFKDGIDHPVISDPQLSEPGKFTLEDRMGLCAVGKLFFNLIQDSSRIFLIQTL